jgi:hypothetical protein
LGFESVMNAECIAKIKTARLDSAQKNKRMTPNVDNRRLDSAF